MNFSIFVFVYFYAFVYDMNTNHIFFSQRYRKNNFSNENFVCFLIMYLVHVDFYAKLLQFTKTTLKSKKKILVIQNTIYTNGKIFRKNYNINTSYFIIIDVQQTFRARKHVR